jgi:glycosyltransferase involved in cell wall biosynthesis
MSRIIVIGASPNSLIVFRGELLKALSSAGHEVTAMAAEEAPKVTVTLAEMGVGFKAYPVQRNGMKPLKDLQTFRALRKAFREFKPDVVLAYTIKPIIWGGLALYGNSGPRFFALVMGLGFAFQDGGLVRRLLTALVTGLYRSALFSSSRVIFQNPDNLQVFTSRRIVAHGKCSLVNGSGVDLAHFDVVPLPADGVVFLTIGRLLGEKGFREYAKAARMVKERYPVAVFRLVGSTDPSPDGISLDEVKAWQVAGLLEYPGATNDVRPYLADCHIYVLPSYHEGMPRTVLEAMAMGRPILTTDVPGCRETVIPGENGLLVPKADVEALAEGMIWFIEHREEWQRMGRRSRQMAEERFDVHKINRQLMDIMGLQQMDRNFT